MGFIVLALWIPGGALAAVLSEVARAESARIVAAARISYGAILTLELLGTGVAFSVADATADPALDASRSIWWAYAVASGVPVTLLTLGAAWRAFRPVRRCTVAVVAAAIACAVYIALPYAYVPPRVPLTGLASFVHGHHTPDVLLLVAPLVIVLLSELTRSRRGATSSDAARSAA